MRSKLSQLLLAATLVVVAAAPALAAGRGWLGVTTQATDSDLRRGLDLDRDGLLVNQVEDGSPADRAGLRKGDVILSYNSRNVTEPSELRTLVRDTAPGRTASLGIWRDGDRRSLTITVGEMSSDDDSEYGIPAPPATPRAPRAPRAPRELRDRDSRDDDSGDNDRHDGDVHRRIIINGREVPEDEMGDLDSKLKDLDIKVKRIGPDGRIDIKGLDKLKDLEGMPGFDRQMFMTPGRGRLGVRVESLNSELSDALGAEGDNGVLVVQVMEDTPAQRAGLRAGDIIVKVEDTAVDSPSELVKALGKQDGKVELEVLRKGARKDIVAELDGRSGSSDGGDMRMRVAPRIRTFRGNPEPGQGSKVYRWNTKDGEGESADLREEIRQLKEELRQLREQMRENK